MNDHPRSHPLASILLFCVAEALFLRKDAPRLPVDSSEEVKAKELSPAEVTDLLRQCLADAGTTATQFIAAFVAYLTVNGGIFLAVRTAFGLAPGTTDGNTQRPTTLLLVVVICVLAVVTSFVNLKACGYMREICRTQHGNIERLNRATKLPGSSLPALCDTRVPLPQHIADCIRLFTRWALAAWILATAIAVFKLIVALRAGG